MLDAKARTVAAGFFVAAALVALTACSNGPDRLAGDVGGKLPDLTSQGLESFGCGEGKAIGPTFQAPEEPYRAQCWKGSPSDTFLDVANATADAVIRATEGSNVTSEACPEDAFGVGGGIACRAALITKGNSSVLVRTVVVLSDPKSVLEKLPEEPTQEQVREALEGAAIEVLVGTEPTPDSSGTTN